MKKIFIGVLLILMISGVLATESPGVGVNNGDIKKIQGAINNYSPLDNSGNVDFQKYAPFKTPLEKNVEKINLWLGVNASWLNAVFGMVPAISWIFLLNLYIMLFAFVTLALNTDGLLGFLDILEKKVNLLFFEAHLANIFGFGIFILLLVTKVYVKLAEFAKNLLGIFWHYVLPWGIVAAVILAILLAVAFVLLVIYVPGAIGILRKLNEEKKEKKVKNKNTVNEEALGRLVEGAIGQPSPA